MCSMPSFPLWWKLPEGRDSSPCWEHSLAQSRQALNKCLLVGWIRMTSCRIANRPYSILLTLKSHLPWATLWICHTSAPQSPTKGVQTSQPGTFPHSTSTSHAYDTDLQIFVSLRQNLFWFLFLGKKNILWNPKKEKRQTPSRKEASGQPAGPSSRSRHTSRNLQETWEWSWKHLLSVPTYSASPKPWRLSCSFLGALVLGM